jgi:hypothetical protein
MPFSGVEFLVLMGAVAFAGALSAAILLALMVWISGVRWRP